MKETHSGVSDARGLGFMAALELDSPGADERGREVQRRLREDEVLLGFSHPVASFRFFPPYIISEPQLKAALEKLDSVLWATE